MPPVGVQGLASLVDTEELARSFNGPDPAICLADVVEDILA